jgi:hypothetical protein
MEFSGKINLTFLFRPPAIAQHCFCGAMNSQEISSKVQMDMGKTGHIWTQRCYEGEVITSTCSEKTLHQEDKKNSNIILSPPCH